MLSNLRHHGKELTDKRALHSNVLWTNWSKFQSLDPLAQK